MEKSRVRVSVSIRKDHLDQRTLILLRTEVGFTRVGLLWSFQPLNEKFQLFDYKWCS